MKESKTVDLDTIFTNQNRSTTLNLKVNSETTTIKNRIKSIYVPRYCQKLGLENKKILPSSEDRLSQLTIKQIDRLIEMQKIKNLLHHNKKGIKPTHICSLSGYPNKHPNVYQANFLAKINNIAIKRNIKKLRTDEFDEAVLTPEEIEQRRVEKEKKNLRFIKEERMNRKVRKKKELSYEEKQEKSIGSIDDNLEEFQQSLKFKNNSLNRQKGYSSLKNYKRKQTNILSETRWFNGMSTYYLDYEEKMNKKKNPESTSITSETDWRDFEALQKSKSRNNFGIKYSRLRTVI